ncbi:MAG: prolyl oligopeptidase family serine peptidase [Chloroflexota bacterium]|nr:prolyl oligopeptidase family serine peptidase [Chloroflexota bacterium]
MASPRIAPYGAWSSPVTLDMAAGETIQLGRIELDGPDTYWVEIRPAEEGRGLVMKRGPGGSAVEVTPPGFSVGTTLHEYGARGYTVHDGVVFFSNFADQRVYRHRIGEDPVPITPEEGDLRFGSKVFDPVRNRIICVCENHLRGGEEVLNEIVAIDPEGRSDPAVLVTDNDFYSWPAVNAACDRLAWVSWDQPNMPWDGTELWVAGIAADGSLVDPVMVAGGVDETVLQPEWGPDGALYFISDRTDWANVYRWLDGEVTPVLQVEGEVSKANWWVGMSSYGFDSDESLVCCYVQRGVWRLVRLGLSDLRVTPLDNPYWVMGHGDLQAAPGRVVFTGGSPTRPISLLELDLEEGSLDVLRVETETEIPPECLSVPIAVEFPTENGLTAHAFYYAPKNDAFAAPEGERPPMLVTCHGGPHEATTPEFSLSIQYWTSRGFALLDVNYGGSAGFGRDYRERLIGEWGVVDVNDCVNAALFLIERGEVDGQRIAISGGSAGGYTALSAMAFRDVFSAGASYFGVSDLEALLNSIHKFDATSLVGLVGPYPLYRKRYSERSPINAADWVSCPVIFFQGLDDTIVPPEQSEAMFDALKSQGVPTTYITFPGEGHGFRQAQTIRRTLEAEFYFYSRLFGFTSADDLTPVRIENLDG